MIISTTVFAIIDIFGEIGCVPGTSESPEDEGPLKEWLNKQAHAPKRLAQKTIKAFPARCTQKTC